MKRSLLILCPSQFGYHLDTFYYCKYGRNDIEITYMGFEGTRPLVNIDGIHVKSIPSQGSKLIRYFRWWLSALRESSTGYDVIFIKYFPGCSLIRCLNPNRQFVFDIRTGSIQLNRWRRKLADILMVAESRLFSKVTIISESLARKLGLRQGCYHVLPLGADVLSDADKKFDALHLLYVGTLSGRQIEKTIQGFAKFYSRHKGQIPMSYTIVGDGYRGELTKLKQMVRELNLESVVKLRGFVHHTKLGELWDVCNVGISFIPINEIYDCQPATKTFEYLLAGMPVVATATTENCRIVNKENGVVIPDTANGFEYGLELLLRNQDVFSSSFIRRSAEMCSWERIVREHLVGNIVGHAKTNPVCSKVLL